MSRNAVRVTLHYISALLAYGFPASYEAVKQAADWFTTPFPNEQRSRIDMIEMSRLEALLSVRPTHDFVQPRLLKLLEQGTSDGQFDLQSDNVYFDTLWALKVLNMARKAGVLDEIMPTNRLRGRVEELLQLSFADKDLALALNLRFEIFGSLTDKQQKRYLQQKLIANWNKNAGLWDVPRDMVWIPDGLRKKQLSAADVRAHRDAFRKMILSTCYVVENLAPLATLYPEIGAPLRSAVELWWEVFYENPTQILHELFPKPYDYVMMLSRTLIMLRALFDEPLIKWGAMHIYAELVAKQSKATESPLHRSLRHALERLIVVELDGEPDSLRLGLSGANVVRVRPRIESLFDNTRMNFAGTVIVKYGSKDDIDAERASFGKLPEMIQNCFVRIPQDTYFDAEMGLSYVVMADLSDYTTLYENMRTVAMIEEPLKRELPPFLLHMHRGSLWDPTTAPRGIIQELYLGPMQMQITSVLKLLWESAVLNEDTDKVAELRVRLTGLCADLSRHQFELEKFPRAYMHGDLHSRNLMIRHNPNGSHTGQLDFKLIDLEKFSLEGDAAMDLGELLVDLQMQIGTDRKPGNRETALISLSQILTAAYHDFARERHDDLFEVRLPLAKARFAIRVAKGKTRFIEFHLKNNKPNSAALVAREILHHCEDAADYLDEVLDAISSPTHTRELFVPAHAEAAIPPRQRPSASAD